MNHWNTRVAEFVLPGHPDKLADAIADEIVSQAFQREREALVGVEVAVHRRVVFVDGRIACEDAKSIDIPAIVRGVYASAGYNTLFPPDLPEIEVSADLCVGPLVENEATFRGFSDDQSIVTGYACSLPGTHHLPVEQALVSRLARAVFELKAHRPDLSLGPDGKLIIYVEESQDGNSFRLQEVSLSLQHQPEWDPVEVRRAIGQVIDQTVAGFALAVPGFDGTHETKIVLNAMGDFVEGGPFGDNGLSGKKLVVDFYGPRIPIGGGAMSGKDFWKVDRAGPIIARRLAIAAVQRLGVKECHVTLGIRPGDRSFRISRVETTGKVAVDPSAVEQLVDLRLASIVGQLSSKAPLVEVARWGHFTGLIEASSLWTNEKGANCRTSEATASKDKGPDAAAAIPASEAFAPDGKRYRFEPSGAYKYSRLAHTPEGWSPEAELTEPELRRWVREQCRAGLRLSERTQRLFLSRIFVESEVVDSESEYLEMGHPGNSFSARCWHSLWLRPDGKGGLVAFETWRTKKNYGGGSGNLTEVRAMGVRSLDDLKASLINTQWRNGFDEKRADEIIRRLLPVNQ